MNTLKIVIERSADMFGAYGENAEGIYGGGDTVIKEEFTPENIPTILKGEYEIVHHLALV